MLEPNLVRNLVKVVARYPKVRIVLSSSWREAFPLTELRSLFPEEMAKRIEGATPVVRFPGEQDRYREILAYLKKHGYENEPWLAIDDDTLNFPDGAPVIWTDPSQGFTGRAASELERRLRACL